MPPAEVNNASYIGSAVLLTPAGGNFSVGRFVYAHPVQFMGDHRNVASFSTSFTFQIIGGAGPRGDGLAFFIAPNISPPNDSGGKCLGIIGNNDAPSQLLPSRHLFAVEFDTVMNADFGDPSPSHVGVDINQMKSDKSSDTQSVPELNLLNDYTFTVWIDYNASGELLQVWMTNRSSSDGLRPSDPLLSFPNCDLSAVFQQQMYVGFSAATGTYSEKHYLYSWNFSTSGLEIQIPPSGPAAQVPSMDVPTCRLCKKKLGLDLGLGLFFSVVTCIVVVSVVRWHCRRAPSRERNEHNIDPALHRYSYRELSGATQAFSNDRLLGEGAFSHVYRGVFRDPDRSTVAVKRLKEGLAKKTEFLSEIRIISSIRHRRLVKLRGWCYEKGKALLVYDYMANGSLDRHLFCESNTGASLTSETRFNILLGVAAALQYLHDGLGECVLHRDVKAANVLLNERFEPVLGDFGLARLIGHDRIVTMTAAGTPGYIAPEVPLTGKATDRSDVHSFGVLALEVASGRKALDFTLPPQEMILVDWIWLLQESNKLMEALDTRILENTEWNKETDNRWRCVLHVGLLCSHPLPDCRPRMRQVIQALMDNTILSLPASRPDILYSNSGPSRPRNLPSSFSTSAPSLHSSRNSPTPTYYTLPTTSSDSKSSSVQHLPHPHSSFPSRASATSVSINLQYSASRSLELQRQSSYSP